MELVPWPDGPRHMEGPTAVEGTPGAEVIPELQPRPEDYVIPKHRWSAFVGTHLNILLRGLGIDTVLLAGGSTDLGVLATAYSARDLGYHLIVLRDACQTHRPGAQEFCMDRLFPRMARVMTVEQAISLIAREPSTPAPDAGPAGMPPGS
jgi:ureidoacrylate peracid hydrolase